jgi:hypothetical protein
MCGGTFRTLDAQAIAQPSCEETLPEQAFRKLSLQVAILAINLGQGEMH